MEFDYRQTEEGRRRFGELELYKLTLEFQDLMAKNGVAWHNHFSGECTIDFCCCEGDNLPDTNYKHFLSSYGSVVKQAFNEVAELLEAQFSRQEMSIIKGIFAKHLKEYNG